MIDIEAIEDTDCKICGQQTLMIFSVDLKPQPVCYTCANAITSQWVPRLIDQYQAYTESHVPIDGLKVDNLGGR